MHPAISYKRFSSPRQARGDSERRQTDLTEEYCKRHHLKLLNTYLDAGLSGFTGENMSDGSALRALLNAAQIGKFKPGTRLIVESLDRLSRREISTAVRLFLDILDMGLVIITLIDGEQVFTKERVDTDLTALIIAIVFLSRANNESRNRRERALQAQQTARRKAREKKIPITAECPSWLKLKGRGDRRRFVIDQDRARVIESIFKMVISGMGQPKIIQYLNAHHVPTPSGVPRWRPGMVAHLIASQAVVGRFHPCLSVVTDGRRRRVPEPAGPIEDYFPAIISAELYEQAQLATRSRFTQKSRGRVPAYSNLANRLASCALCGSVLHRAGSRSSWAYLRCSGSYVRECTNRFGFPYWQVEAFLLALDDLTEFISRLISQIGPTPNRDIEIRLRDTAYDADRVDIAEREAFLARFRVKKDRAKSANVVERDLGRRALIAEFREMIERIVLQADRTLTIHLKVNTVGFRIVYILGREGIQGAQVRLPEGTTGFIGRSVLAALIPPVKIRSVSAPEVDQEAFRRPNFDRLLELIRVVYIVDGDWQVFIPDPMQMAEVVLIAEQTSRPQ
jgi:DNA invertase Pin-like site-specific DNA recombinase